MSTLSFPLTNQVAKHLIFIRKHPNCTFEELNKKFDGIDYMELVNLCISGYLLCTSAANLSKTFLNGVFQVSGSDKFWASPKTDEFIENRIRSWLQWVIPTSISSIALILSIISLWLSQLPQVTTVKILP